MNEDRRFFYLVFTKIVNSVSFLLYFDTCVKQLLPCKSDFHCQRSLSILHKLRLVLSFSYVLYTFEGGRSTRAYLGGEVFRRV